MRLTRSCSARYVRLRSSRSATTGTRLSWIGRGLEAFWRPIRSRDPRLLKVEGRCFAERRRQVGALVLRPCRRAVPRNLVSPRNLPSLPRPGFSVPGRSLLRAASGRPPARRRQNRDSADRFCWVGLIILRRRASRAPRCDGCGHSQPTWSAIASPHVHRFRFVSAGCGRAKQMITPVPAAAVSLTPLWKSPLAVHGTPSWPFTSATVLEV
jgi:hypothetical protein